MSPPTFPSFPHLPLELRNAIWHHSLPTITTLHILETGDLDVTSISPPPGHYLATKESRAAYLSRGFKPYSIYTTEDWADIHVNKDTILQIVVTPAKNLKADLMVTWTELWVVLHDALMEVKRVHVVCSQPERLSRLWMSPESGLVAMGKSHWDEEVFGKEVVASDRACRESLKEGIVVSCSVVTLEELERGSGEVVESRELVEERIVVGFGDEVEFCSTRVFEMVGEERNTEVEEWEEVVSGGETSEGEPLTEKAMERFIQETGWVPNSSAPSSEYSVDVVYDGELWLTVS